MVPLSGNESTGNESTGALARRARIKDIRHQIAAGTYETPDKIEAAVKAFLDSAEGQPPDEALPGGRRRAK